MNYVHELWTMNWGSWHWKGDRDQDHPHEKEMQKSKVAVWRGLTNSCKKKKSKKQRKYTFPFCLTNPCSFSQVHLRLTSCKLTYLTTPICPDSPFTLTHSALITFHVSLTLYSTPSLQRPLSSLKAETRPFVTVSSTLCSVLVYRRPHQHFCWLMKWTAWEDFPTFQCSVRM